jgi:hypothetical protein
MRLGLALYRIGVLGILLTIVVFFQEPLHSSLKVPSSWPSVLILFGFPVLAGLLVAWARRSYFEGQGKTLFILSHGVALISAFWLILWCFVWLAIVSNLGEKAEMIIKHMAYLHLFGVGFTIAGYVTGWMATTRGERSARFLMALSWAVSYMAWFNLYLQPSLQWLWAPAIGGLTAVLGAYLVSRQVKRVEAPAQLS